MVVVCDEEDGGKCGGYGIGEENDGGGSWGML